MKRLTTLVLFLATAVLAGAQQSSIDTQKLELIRKMSPEERAKLKARLEEIKKLSPAERERLNENLKKIKTMPAEEVKKATERAAKLTEKDHREFVELASGFFKWERRMGYQEGFPRGLFFQWLKRDKPGKLEEIRSMEPGPGTPRVDEFIRLYHEFRDHTLAKTEEHARRHRCMTVEDVQALGDLSAKDFWVRWSEVTRNCGRKAIPGPVPPRPLDPPKK
ncbi:MAG: DUF3106 domain-containing protein [Planctomycetes bacterium]|nr:DUF3106 domain-containing protein [Planctomycetota bacterium]